MSLFILSDSQIDRELQEYLLTSQWLNSVNDKGHFQRVSVALVPTIDV